MSAHLLPQLLTTAAERASDRIAVTDSRGSLTYAELEMRANRIAHLLHEAGVRLHDRVGLFLPKSADAIAGLYGIMKSGAAYVPLDVFAPPQRLAFIAQNCGIRCLVTAREENEAWNAMLDYGAQLETFVVTDSTAEEVAPPRSGRLLGSDALAAMPTSVPPQLTIDLDLAYVLYTSGSTGQPKGVMLSHLNALTFVRWCHHHFGTTDSDVFSNHAPLHFDLTILDIYLAAMSMAPLVTVPPALSVFPIEVASFIEHHGITIWYSVPSILSMLVLHGKLTPGRLPSLRQVIFAGEVFPTKHLRALMELIPQARFTNLYGPTETNVCTYFDVSPLPPEQVSPIPIGRAIDNVDVFAMTEDGRRAVAGEVGELYVRGTTVAYGYWGDPGRTAGGFVTNPLGPAQDRVYRTGDLVRENENGEYLFLGRRDHQIKSRGFRIELGDIETALYAHPAVAECVAIPIPDEVVGNRIKAYVVRKDATVTEQELARFCATLLPKYMIPEQIEFPNVLPKTSTGKIDRPLLAAASL